MASEREAEECSLCGTEGEELAERVGGMWEKFELDIATCGLSIMGVFGGPGPTDGSFAYTIGLMDRGWPELILQGCSPQTAQQLLNNIAYDAFQSGLQPRHGDLITEVANLPLRVGTVSQESVNEYLRQAVYRAERKGLPEPQALQVILCDAEGLFPGEPGYNAEYMKLQNCMAPGGQWDFWVN